MITVPAFAWRGGSVRRALTIGSGFGVALGALAWIDSGFFLGFVAAFVLGGAIWGVLMSRRMSRYWPQSRQVPDSERVELVKGARRGKSSSDPKWAEETIAYCRGMRAAEVKPVVRWLVWLVVFAFALSAAYDTVEGSVGNGIASCIYFAAILVELFWWPKRQARLLENCDRAARHATDVLERNDAR